MYVGAPNVHTSVIIINRLADFEFARQSTTTAHVELLHQDDKVFTHIVKQQGAGIVIRDKPLVVPLAVDTASLQQPFCGRSSARDAIQKNEHQ